MCLKRRRDRAKAPPAPPGGGKRDPQDLGMAPPPRGGWGSFGGEEGEARGGR